MMAMVVNKPPSPGLQADTTRLPEVVMVDSLVQSECHHGIRAQKP